MSDAPLRSGPADTTRPGSWGVSYFLRHGTLANLVMALLLIAGVLAATRIRSQFFPDVVTTEISVSVDWAGAGAEDVDRAIIDRIEPALLAVDRVVSVSSEAREGSASISMEFETDTDLARAADAVEAALAAISDLPSDADDPVVRQGAWRDRVTDVVITGPVGVDQLVRIADEFTQALFQAGITRTTFQGLAAPEVGIEVAMIDLIRHDLTMADIAAAIAQQVTSGPVGALDDGTARLRTGAELRAPLDLGQIVLRTGADGAKLVLGDVATLSVPGADQRRAAFVGDNPAITLRVDRTAQGDAIAMQATVAGLAASMAATLPPGTSIDLVRKRAELIEDRVTLLVDNALQGLAMVVALLFLFLNARTAFWVATGVPIAILSGLAVMYAAGLTLNMISLFAMIITVGIIVDDAIIVAEHTEYRARSLNEPPVIAAERTILRMAGPIVASTLIIVIAFLGLTVIGGPFGALIEDIPITVTAVLLASLVECFYILPNHMAHAVRNVHAPRWYDWPSTQVNRGLDWFNIHITRPVVRLTLDLRYPLVAFALFLMASQFALYLRGDVTFRFFVAPEQAVVTGSFAMADGATRHDTLAMMREVQRATDAVGRNFAAEHGRNPVTYALAEVGGSSGRNLDGAASKDADLLGGITIELIDPDLRPYSSPAVATAIREEIADHPLLEEMSFRSARFGPGGASLSVDLFGTSTESLQAAAAALELALVPFPAVSGVEDTLASDKNDLVVNLTPFGQSLGLDTATLAQGLRDHLNGVEVATFPDGRRTATIRLSAPANERAADFLDTMLLRTPTGAYVPLSDIVTVDKRPGLATILRENGQRVITVTGEVNEDRPAAAAEVEAALTASILPRIAADHGVTFRLSGQRAQQDEFLADAGIATVLCLIGIYLCLAWITATWFRPFMVMTVIPFGVAGAIWGHWVWDLPLSLFSIVGLITMAGIITNDAIVLVSTVDEYAAERGLRGAIVDAVATRLRPIFLTSSTNIVGLIPLLFERSSQVEFLKSTVVTFVFGLSVGLVLILFVVPAILMIEADIRQGVTALRRAVRGKRANAAMSGRVRLAGVGMLAALGVAMGPYLWQGAWPAWMLGLWPAMATAPGLAALALFLGISLVICAVVAIAGPGRTSDPR